MERNMRLVSCRTTTDNLLLRLCPTVRTQSSTACDTQFVHQSCHGESCGLWDDTPPEFHAFGLGACWVYTMWGLVAAFLLAAQCTIGEYAISRMRLVLSMRMQAKLFQGNTLYALVSSGIDNYDQRMTDDMQNALEDAVGKLTGSVSNLFNVSQIASAAVFNLYYASRDVHKVLCSYIDKYCCC